MKSNHNLIFVLLISAVIFLTSCAGLKEKKEMLSICEKITDGRIKNTCIAIAEEDAAQCDKISDNQENVDEKGFCYMAVALKTKKASICEKPHIPKFTCKALVENSSSGCDEALQKEPYGMNCYVRSAELTKNPDLCDRYAQAVGIQGVQTLECKALIEKDATKCSKEDLPKCYFATASLKGDAAICDSIPNAPYIPNIQKVKEMCNAVAKRDVSALDCKVEFKPATTWEESIVTYKACIAVAALTEDASTCDKIVIKGDWVSPDPNPIDKCYHNIILLKSGVFPIETVINSLDRIWG